MPTNKYEFNVIARSLPQLITAKQLERIRGLCRELNLQHNEECEEMFGQDENGEDVTVDMLSVKAASHLIEYLLELKGEN